MANSDHHPQCFKVREPGDPNAPCICEPAHVDGPPEDCPANECCICAVIYCPHGEPLHFHHDGCPACYLEQQRGKRDCPHDRISRREVSDPGINALLDVDSVAGYWCDKCGHRFTPIKPNQRVVED